VKILFAIAHVSKGGGQSLQAFQLWRHLSERFETELLCLRARDSSHRELEAEGVSSVGDLRFPAGVLDLARAIRARRRSYHVLQAFDTYYALPAARLAWHGPVCLRMGMDPARDLGSRYGRGAEAAARAGLPFLLDGVHIVANSPTLRDAFAPWGAVFIPNGVDLERLQISESKEEARRVLGLPPDAPLLLFVGKVIPRKGLEDLLDALRSVDGARAVVVGHTSEENYGDRYYRHLLSEFRDVTGRVTFTGEVPFREIPLFLRSADVFVFPSRLEGSPNAVLEAMGAGLPVVAYDTPEHEALIRSGENGFLYRDRRDLAAILRDLLRDAGLRERVGAAGTRLVRERFSFVAAADSYARLYESLAGKKR